MLSKHYPASDNTFINAEPTFDSENVYTTSVFTDSDNCYRIDQFFVDDKPTTHYIVLWWRKEKFGQKVMFIDASKYMSTYKPEKLLKKYLKSIPKIEDKPTTMKTIQINEYPVSLLDVLNIAEEKFPYPLEYTSIEMGELDHSTDYPIEFSREVIFEAGNLLGKVLTIGGWLEIRQEEAEEECYISFVGNLAFDRDWENPILGDCEGVLGYYNIEKQTWELSIDSY